MFTRLLSSITNSYIVSFLRDLLSGYVENVDSKQLKASLAKGEPPHLFAKCLRMFTRLLSSITNSYIVSFLRDLLSGYVENVDSKQLKASLAKGEVSLFDLKLKEDIFDFLSLPITVAIGYVRVLGISIPWRSLASKPTVVTIEDVIIVLKTESAAEWDEQKEIQLKEEYKRKSLEVHDFINLSQQHDKPKSLMWRISASLLASLEVKIKNVHLVLEDTHSCGISRKVVFGAQVKHASLSSSRTNFSSHPTVAGKQNVSCKVAEVQQFGIYLDSYPIEPKSSPFPVSPDEHHKKAFEYLQRVIRYESYLLQPVDGELRIITTKVPVRVGLNECYSPHDEDWIPSGMGNNQSNDPGVSTVLPAIYVGFKFPEAEFRFAYDQLMDLSEIIHYHIYIYGNFYYAIYYRDKDLHGSADEEKEYAVAWTTKIGILADSNGSGNSYAVVSVKYDFH
ncbi:hypothetical protein Pmar_PMAR017449 [Perkinsus marinus ATCC 50983]|uniref:Chorein N-terminal domain-containing protein n=1 Tax=Perkinsus marinus (strain ATCC 50983 / TXsc) TaxID=423536 RepID=C5KG01_PERM5|nr:hypothetical protein Pmar_PMAR017449 [Perkinsus marinus ATCC 50983]EER16565.1 hypothetical protein Pmar_PMAR017449 [Perkinsus marinus ATCC 50983]|eukprot:XP_002784769.1 hypothetical protein Pmar_PMAR017449 [Perkinsus marinus ATCC 50983]